MVLAGISINPNQAGGTTFCTQPVFLAPNFTMDATFAITGMKVSISQNYHFGEDELHIVGYSGPILGYWYSQQGYLTLTGSSDINDYIQAIRLIQYSNHAAAPSKGVRTITFSLDDADYLPDTQHFYRFISDIGIYWTAAKVQAESVAMQYHGLQGYLATITSAVENAFIQQKTKGVGWIGASDHAIEGDWRWVTGPEGLEDGGHGRLFWRGSGYQAKLNPGTYGPVNGAYQNWNRYDVPYSASLPTTNWEPNDSGGNEDYAHITFFVNNPTESLKWNDLPAGGSSGEYTPQGYLIEYGDMPGDPVVNLSADIALHVNTISFSANQKFTKCQGDPVQLNQQDNLATYNWSPATGLSNSTISDPLAKPNVSNVYTVIATNGSCMDSAKFVVTINPAPVSTLVKVTNICKGNIVQLDAGLHTSYAWSTGSTAKTIPVTSTGTYVVKLTDKIGCTKIDTAVVNVQSTPKMDLSGLNKLVCGSPEVTLNISKDKGEWLITNMMSGQKFTSPSIQVASYGIYPFGFNLTDAFGCKADTFLTLSFRDIPKLNLGNDTTICNAQSIILDAGPDLASYLWSTKDTLRTIKVQAQGLYSVIVKNQYGCPNQTQIQVNMDDLPKLDLSKLDTLHCGVKSALLQLSADKGTFQLKSSDPDVTINGLNVAVSKYNSYPFSYKVTDQFACSAQANFTIGFHEIPALNLGNDTTICNPKSIVLDAGAGMAAYAWSTKDTLRTIKVQSAGNYNVLIRSNYGCTNLDQISVNFVAVPKLDLSKLDTLSCGVKSTIVQISADKGKYVLKSTDPLVKINGLSATASEYGTYPFNFLATDQYACASDTSFTIGFHEIPLLNLGNDTTICKPQSLLLDAGAGMASYRWSTKDSLRSIKVQTAGTDGVLIRSKYGCFNQDQIQVGFVAVPKLDLSKLDTLICGIKSTIVQITADKGKYVLKSNDPLVTVNGLSVNTSQFGTYPFNFKSTDQYACATDTSFTIGFHATPVVQLGNDTTICNPSSILLDAGAGLNTYQWSTGDSMRVVEVKKQGKYNVLVENNYGCSSKDSVHVYFTDKPRLNLSSLDTLVCGSRTSLLKITVDKGKFQLSSKDSGVNISGLSAAVPVYGIYPFSFVSTDQYGCKSDTSFTMGFHKIPKVNFSIDELNCYGYNLQATYIGDATIPNARFTWVFGGDTISAKLGRNIESIPLGVDQPKRDLQLTVTEAGCSDSSKIRDIHVIPTLSMSVVNPVQCQPVSFTFNGFNTETGVQYLWNFGDGTFSNLKDIVHKYVKEGYYDVSLTVTTDKGCTNVATKKKMVYVAPIPTVGFSILPTTCLDPGHDTLNYVGSAGIKDTYYWNLKGFDPAEIVQTPDSTAGPFVFDLINKPKTKLSLHVTSSYGCLSDTASLEVKRKPVYSFTASPLDGCAPLPVSFRAHADDPVDQLSFHWDYGDGQNGSGADVNHSYMVPNLVHDLRLDVTSSLTGCLDTIYKEKFIVIHPNPKAGFTLDHDIVYNDMPRVSFFNSGIDGVNYYWDFGDGTHSREKDPVHDFQAIGYKRVIQTVYNQFDCQDTTSRAVTIVFNKLYPPNAISPGASNAVDRVFLLKAEGIRAEGYHMMILSRWNDLVFECKNEIKGWDGKMDNGQYAPAGNYVWILECFDFLGRPHRQTGSLVLLY